MNDKRAKARRVKKGGTVVGKLSASERETLKAIRIWDEDEALRTGGRF